MRKPNAMTMLLILIIGLGALTMSGCASTPKPGQRGYTTHTHYEDNYGWHSSYR
jgi:starvation-inducible outer membrane lipoprotein